MLSGASMAWLALAAPATYPPNGITVIRTTAIRTTASGTIELDLYLSSPIHLAAGEMTVFVDGRRVQAFTVQPVDHLTRIVVALPPTVFAALPNRGELVVQYTASGAGIVPLYQPWYFGPLDKRRLDKEPIMP
jgi:hypothetical protein